MEGARFSAAPNFWAGQDSAVEKIANAANKIRMVYWAAKALGAGILPSFDFTIRLTISVQA